MIEVYDMTLSSLRKKYLCSYFKIVSENEKTYTISLMKEEKGEITFKTPGHSKRLRKEIFESELALGRIKKINLYSKKDR